MIYYPEMICVSEIHFDVRDNKVYDVKFVGGCKGNLLSIAALVEGMEIDEIIRRLRGLSCDTGVSSCPERFIEALECYKRGEMDKLGGLSDKEHLDRQQGKWDHSYMIMPEMFGEEISHPAQRTLEIIKDKDAKNILELGFGQGRDTMHFAQNGYNVTGLDYSQVGLDATKTKAENLGLADKINLVKHDLREKFPLEDESFDVCYSHMLFNMAFTEEETIHMMNEAYRLLKKGGYHIFTVRNDMDAHFGQGTQRGDCLFENDGYIVRFFTKENIEKIKGDFEIEAIEYFEEAELPRKLYCIIMKK
ncbi:MAG: TIGR03905 family TSCPD domain-containing protein [Clostridia bacterium]|nr:TIGR03905 family TSCPD domain-containing protein [Clostridia bacterium]